MTPVLKRCSKCGDTKSIELFYKSKRRKDGHEGICAKCHRDYDKIKETGNKIRYRTDLAFKNKVKERRLRSSRKYIKTEKYKEYIKKYRSRQYVKEAIKKRHLRWRRSKEGVIHMRMYYKNKRKYNTSYRIRGLLFLRMSKLVKGINKSASTMEILGCSVEKLKAHLQDSAIKNGYHDFNINNYKSSEYHIDHIIPCSAFNLEDKQQVLKCFNYKNLQILEAKTNFIKNNRIMEGLCLK